MRSASALQPALSPPAPEPQVERRRTRRDVDVADSIAHTILAGFDRHYSRFRYHAQLAKARYEAGDFHAIRRLASERIAFYDQRVREAIERLEKEFQAEELSETIWLQVKRQYVGLLRKHHQPELAETFFNSVCCRILHRSYFHND